MQPPVPNFNPRPPRGGRQPPFSKYSHGPIISIHALREEGDASSSLDIFLSSLFQSTPSARRATRTRPRNFRFPAISIHALREESDSTHRTASYGSTDFNPRPPRGERQQLQSYARTAKLFQSTPSARRATAVLIVYICVFVDFNPRPPRGGRPGRQNHTTRKDDISIHALREEGDQHRLRCRRRTAAFQSTPSVGKATGQAQDPGTRQAISIRNLHMEGDYRQADCLRRGIHDFNPRPPRGERLQAGGRHPAERINFNPRPPRGERPFSTGI